MKLTIDIAKIPEEEKSELVVLLLEIIRQQAETGVVKILRQVRSRIDAIFIPQFLPVSGIASSVLEGLHFILHLFGVNVH